MNLKSFRVQNFRRLKDVLIELENPTSIFVGANNSGKTSATHIFQLFLSDSGERFSIHDFSAGCWAQFNAMTSAPTSEPAVMPAITLDLWFAVKDIDMHRVIDLLPTLDWKDTLLGVRIEFGAKDPAQLIANFNEAKQRPKGIDHETASEDYRPWPKSMTDYLSRRLNAEFEKRFYVLDRSEFDINLKQKAGYTPRPLGTKERPGAKILKTLLRVDFLNAQRHISDVSSPGRSEDLSRRLSKFYERNLDQRSDEEAFDALRALANSENQLNLHLAKVFTPTLNRLNDLGYPGFYDPHLVIRSALNPESIMKQNAQVHYALDVPDEPNGGVFLPDKYNGLGFKNLIYMVIEVLDFHARWKEEVEQRAPLHLVFIEEPEAHLHAQLQQVFIRKILEILPKDESDLATFTTQLVVTTHSPHIVYESGFTPIRYFRRKGSKERLQSSEVLNLSYFYGASKDDTREFLQQYMKLTHCDLFFADAAILVEGNVERLLLPLMIDQSASELKKNYLSILEVGGAFAHRFRELIEFLGIPALVITDLDSVLNKSEDPACQDSDESESGKSCLTGTPEAITSNQTLIQWLPKLKNISALLEANEELKTQKPSSESPAHVRVCYQTFEEVTWEDQTDRLAGRTFEEAFALRNLKWCQDSIRAHLLLKVTKEGKKYSLLDIAERLFKRVNSGFKKTEFALGLMAENRGNWKTPSYIQEGLRWLSKQLAPVKVPALKEESATHSDHETPNR